jgi:hypothetical protein
VNLAGERQSSGKLLAEMVRMIVPLTVPFRAVVSSIARVQCDAQVSFVKKQTILMTFALLR